MISNNPPMPYQNQKQARRFLVRYLSDTTSSPRVGVILVLNCPIIHPIMSRRNDRRLPMDDKVLYRTLHKFLMVQRKCPPHNVSQFGLGPRAGAPEEET